MPGDVLEKMKRYISFGEADEANLRSLADAVEPELPAVVDRFYAEILRHPDASRVFVDGEAQIRRLRGHLANWLKTLFSGQYDTEYAIQRAAIGRAHVRVGLPQHYMFTAMEVVRQELERIILRVKGSSAADCIRSLHKLLTLETGLMLESYKASYSDDVRQIERAALQERMMRAERLAEIGQLAASLAHEIKNPLAGISGAVQVIHDEMRPNDPHREILEQVLRHIDRLDGTVKDLLTYARPTPPRFKSFDVGGVIERVLNLLRREPAFSEIDLEYEILADTTRIEADEHQLEQMLVNLLLNAAHASRSGDIVSLRLSGNARELAIVIEDRGQGMDAETSLRALEPFFTTKARGTGLGLPICRRIVETHGGTLRLDSELGHGTTVEIVLPIRRDGDRGPDAT